MCEYQNVQVSHLGRKLVTLTAITRTHLETRTGFTCPGQAESSSTGTDSTVEGDLTGGYLKMSPFLFHAAVLAVCARKARLRAQSWPCGQTRKSLLVSIQK